MFVIAGVTGHVGSAVATKLLADGKKIKVLVRDAKKGADWSSKGAEVAEGSLDDQAFLTAALKGAAGFFILLPPNYTAADFYADQRKTADSIAGAAKASGVPHVVMLSSIGAELSEGNGPIKGLHYLENALRTAGVKLTAIRAGSFQENVLMSLAPAREMGILPNFVGSADYPMPMIATKDIGAQAATSLLNPPPKSEIIDLQGPAYTQRQVAEKLGKKLGKTLQIVDIPPAGHAEAMMKGGMSKQFADIYAEMYAGFASGKIKPQGDRMIAGKLELDAVIATIPA